MADTFTVLLTVILNSFFSFLGVTLYLVELYLAKLFVEELKLELVFKRVTTLVRFILALIISSLAFSLLNTYPSKYLGIIFGNGVPLTKILALVEAIVFFTLLYVLFRNRQNREKRAPGPVTPTTRVPPLKVPAARRSWEEEG